MLFYYNFFIILGGKSSASNPVPIEIFDTEIGAFYRFKQLMMNRHTFFIFENDIFLLGGFNLKSHVPLGELFKISINKILANSPLIKIISKKKLKK